MGNHAVFAPSASPRWLACPGSISMSEGIEESTSEYAHEGSVCHDVAADCMKTNKKADTYTGQTVDGVLMTQELIEGIQMYIDEIHGLAKELGVRGGKIELDVQITEDCWGRLDAALWTPEIAVLCDLKMGKGVLVSADNNTQLMIYAIGFLKWLQVEPYGLKPGIIRLVIIQPRTVDPIRVWEISREELFEWYKKTLKPAIDNIKSGDATCIPGEEQCRWCPAGAQCTARAKATMMDATSAFKPFLGQESMIVSMPEIAAINTPILTIAVASELKKSFKRIQDWMKSVDSFLMEKALAGENIPGFKLVEGRSVRKWKADEKEVVAFLTGCKVDPYTKNLITPPAAEKLLGKKEATALGLEKYIIKPPGNPTLVDADDKRPAMTLEVEKEFEEFVEEVPTTVDLGLVNMFDKVEAPILIVSEDDEPEVKGLSLLDRLAMADIPDEEVEEMITTDEVVSTLKEIVDETATSGDLEVVARVAPGPNPTLPKTAAKRMNVLNMGRGGVTLTEAAKSLGCGVNTIKMHLRYLAERDGYGFEIYSDGTFKVLS